jgi:hypothetical protein
MITSNFFYLLGETLSGDRASIYVPQFYLEHPSALSLHIMGALLAKVMFCTMRMCPGNLFLATPMVNSVSLAKKVRK